MRNWYVVLRRFGMFIVAVPLDTVGSQVEARSSDELVRYAPLAATAVPGSARSRSGRWC
ncbi:hypothetical protein SK571_40595 [Lentzea sp. BCCO 10_0798]|uniref:Uncharacterized protein n=1 Tax=Lentzea kristufekii TaxID=3095430 RepID=A0ABU4U555_9PSEU|nr:hypothetical protein [Lentzea sp. BCCO 10_0798]MDX8055713.1 hypothetical protein [Lentzea sp. BCCO 10_0798]